MSRVLGKLNSKKLKIRFVLNNQMNLRNKETTNHTNGTNKLKKFTTEYTEKNKTHREHRATPLLLNLFFYKTQPTTPNFGRIL
jgi:hypothetical protein